MGGEEERGVEEASEMGEVEGRMRGSWVMRASMWMAARSLMMA